MDEVEGADVIQFSFVEAKREGVDDRAVVLGKGPVSLPRDDHVPGGDSPLPPQVGDVHAGFGKPAGQQVPEAVQAGHADIGGRVAVDGGIGGHVGTVPAGVGDARGRVGIDVVIPNGNEL